MNLPRFIIVLAAFWFVAVVPAAPPNIIVVMPDDMGYGDLASHGNPVIKTPALDAFRAESVRFTDFQVSPTCAPTRAALLTGRHEFKNGVTHTIHERERLTLKATTLAQVLQSAGYATGIFGKWHLGDEPERRPDARGFTESFSHGAGGIGQTYAGTCGDAPGNTYFDPAILHNGKFVKTKGYCTDVFFRQAETWIDAIKGRQPFFAFITPNTPHTPLDVPESYAAMYPEVPPDVAKFYGMITNIDENFGRLMARLRSAGLEKNTLVIFLTDNGSATGAKFYNAGMRGNKGSAYQGGTRVPSFWRWPGVITGGRDVDRLTAHIDMFRTLAEIGGAQLTAEVEAQVEGRNLLPLLKDASAPWPDRFLVTHVGRWPRGQVADWKHKKSAIRNARFTLVEDAELHDLQADPGQKKNVIGEHPEEVAKLRAAYDAWWESVLPHMDNEDAELPNMNPFKALYWKQFGGGPDEELRRKMDPANLAPGRR